MQYTLGETVIAISDNAKGEIVTLLSSTFFIRWLDSNNIVEYPLETESVRKLWPWEQNS